MIDFVSIVSSVTDLKRFVKYFLKKVYCLDSIGGSRIVALLVCDWVRY